MRIDSGRFTVRLAESEADVAAAQRLRYQVFVSEMGASVSDEDHAEKRERDRFDPFCEHLLLIDNSDENGPAGSVVGVYRLLTSSAALGAGDRPAPGFYSASEYDLAAIKRHPREALELGRSCVAAPYRGKAAMQLLWWGLSQYIDLRGVGLLFGVASFHGADVQPLAQPLSYLHHHHLAPEAMRPRTQPEHYVSMEILTAEEVDRTAAMRAIPSLIKGYLRLGGFVGDGAFVDREFNTVDVLVLMETARITERYKKFYARRSPSDVARIVG